MSYEQNENIDKEIETRKMNRTIILELKNKITDTKNLLEGYNSRLVRQKNQQA